MGRLPSQRLFTVIGTFAANSEVDGYQMLTNIEDASRLMRYPVGNITGWRLWLNEPLKPIRWASRNAAAGQLNGGTGASAKGNVPNRCAGEGLMGLGLPSLDVAVAAFNIITLAGSDGNGEAKGKWRFYKRRANAASE